LLLVHVFRKGPIGLELAVGAAVFLRGRERIGADVGGFADGFFGLLFGFYEPAFALEAEAADGGRGIGSIEKGAGAALGDGAIDDALQDLGDGELDGGFVFEKGDAVVSFDAREVRFAVPAVTPAEVGAVHGEGAALLAAGFDVAAALFGLCGRSARFGGDRGF
jgi:hypothetical protein